MLRTIKNKDNDQFGFVPYYGAKNTYNQLYSMKTNSLQRFCFAILLVLLTPFATLRADYYSTTNYTLCPNETLSLGSITISSPGIYTINYTAADGTDSIVDVVVTYFSDYIYKEYRDLLLGETITWRGQIVDGSKPTYYDRYKSIHGCDSIYELHVTTSTYFPAYFSYDTIKVCQSAFPYEWKGILRPTPGTYYDVHQTKQGTDSIEAITILQIPTKETQEMVWLCKGNTTYLPGVGEVTLPGQYTATYLSSVGCDSLHIYIVNYAPTYYFEEYRTVLEGEPLTWHGKTYYPTQNINLYDNQVTTFGCDSNYVLNVTVIHPTTNGYLIEEKARICKGDFYEWRGNKYWQSGTYFDSLRTVDNLKDSVYCLRLTVQEPFFSQLTVSICEGERVDILGKTYSQPAIIRDTLLSSFGCDSIIEIIILQNRAYRFYEEKTLSDQQIPYHWHGQEIVATGQYFDSHQTINGCDSIYELHVTVCPTYNFIEEVAVCRNDLPYKWHGMQISGEGIYTDSYLTKDGFDSIYHLHLVVAPIYRSTRQITICEGEQISIGGKNYASPTTICDTLTSSNGCDSIVTTILNVLPRFIKRDTITINDQQLPYEWRGHIITASGTYRADYQTISGCDSSYICFIRVLPTYHFVKDTALCANEAPYLWFGNNYSESGTYYHRLQTVDGNDSIYQLNLIVWDKYETTRQINICGGESCTVNGKVYTTPTMLYDTLLTQYGCDSVIRTVINVLPRFLQRDTVTVSDQALPYLWRGQSITQTGTYRTDYQGANGCDSSYVRFVRVLKSYRFTQDAVICASEAPYPWRGGSYSVSGTYHTEYKTVDGQDSIYQLNLIVYPEKNRIEQIEMCHGEVFTYKGNTYRSDTILIDTLLTPQGCDSIVRYVVRFHHDYYYHDTLVVSTDQLPIRWHNKELTVSGTHKAEYITIHGCDSIYECYLVVYPTHVIIKDTAICETEAPYLWRGRAYYNSGIYSEPYQTDMRKDSIYQLRLTVNPVSRETHYYQFCPGGSVHIDGHVFTSNGTYIDTIRTQQGCDSIITYVISEAPTYKVSDTLHISDQETRTWRGQYIRLSGTYTDNLSSVAGCDSIYELVVYVHPTYLFQTDTMLCQTEEPFTWRGHTYSRSTGATIFEDKYQTVWGYDSIYRLNVQFYPKYHHTKNLYLCDGASVMYGGVEYTAPTVFEDTLISQSGCDSILRVSIQYAPHFFASDTIHISDKQVEHWHGQTITQSGTYLDSHKNAYGCDSTYEHVVYVHPTYLFVTDTMLCQTYEPFTWRGHTYSRHGNTTIEEKYSTVFGYDSIYQLNITYFPTYNQTIQLFMCDGASVTYQGKTYTHTGTFSDTLLTVNGCDSITTVVVNMAHNFLSSDTIHISDKDTIIWHGHTITQSGTYLDSHTTKWGCDSTYERVVYVHPTYLFVTDTMICQSNEPLVWRGKAYSRSGAHTIEEKFTTVWGYDSIYQLNFDTYPQYRYTQQLTICEGGNAIFGDKVYTQTGTFVDSLLTVDGCDSIITVVVNMARNFLLHDTVHMSNRDTMYWHGQTITQSGTYVDMHQTTDGCDSTYMRTVIVHSTYVFEETAIICQSDAPYPWRGREFYQLGSFTYEDPYKTHDGYDSIYRLHLTINPTYEFHQQLQICKGSSIEYNGITYTTPGDYTYKYRSSTGCDSICHIHVNLQDSYYRSDTAYINDGDSYVWSANGKTYTDPCVDIIYEKTTTGCDSIMQLVLLRNPSYLFKDSAVICEPDTFPYYVWRGHEYNQSGVYYDSLFTMHGQDSIYQLSLVIHPRSFTAIYKDICENETFTFNGREVTESGVYNDTLTTVFGCDSVIQLSINFHKYEIVRFDTICDGDTVWWYGEEATEEAIYQVRKPNENGCDSLFNLNLTLLYDFHRNYSDTICEDKLLHNEPYLFGPNQRPMWGKWNDATQHYEDSIYWNCDHTNYFHLVVLPERIYVDTTEICQGDSVWFARHNGTILWVTQPGKYYDTIPATGSTEIYSCDSIVCHYVLVKPTSKDTIIKHISDKDSIFFGNKWLHETGIYHDTVPMSHGGCDSITTLELYVDTTYFFLDSIQICKPHYYGPNDNRNTPYIWQGHKRIDGSPYEIYNEGIYWDSLITQYTRVDSIYCLKVNVYPTYLVPQQITLCEGDSLRFGSGWVKQQGIYMDTLRSINGCDSIIQLSVNMLPSYFKQVTAEISDKDSYTWNLRDHTGAYDRVLTVGGIYRDTLETVLGCDSIIELTLTVHPTYFIKDSVTVCQSELPYIWQGHHADRRLYQSGTYFDSLQTKAGFDSIYRLELTVLPSYKKRLVFSTCEDDSIRYRNKVYTRPGIYYDTLQSIDFCDSILIIDYQWRDKYLINKTAQTGSNNPYVWTEGSITKTLYASGVYYDTLQAVTGCDSIICLTLTVYPEYLFEERELVCASETPFWWHGKPLYYSGIYYDSLQTVHHYDSIYRLNFTVLDTAHAAITLAVCQGETLTYNGRTYDRGGLYYDTLTCANGCDSIVAVSVQVQPGYFMPQTAQTADNRPYLWRGKVLQYPGVYYDSLTSVTGCDSIYQLTLTVYPTYHYAETMTVCESELPVVWHNRHLLASGIYYDSLQTVQHYDSIYRLDLIVLDTAYRDIHIRLCRGEKMTIGNTIYQESGIYYDTLHTMYNCDSILAIHVQVLPDYFFSDTITTTSRVPYQWHGKTFTHTGVYYDSLQTVEGCDSIYQLVLTINPAQLVHDTIIHRCEADLPFVWNGASYNESVYFEDTVTINGVDNIYRVNLVVCRTSRAQFDVLICEGDTYQYNGRIFDSNTPEGVYRDTLSNNCGCDSIVSIVFRRYTPKIERVTAHISDRQTYTWEGHNRVLRFAGIYRDTVRSVLTGCDSVIYELTLHVHPTYKQDTTVTICREDAPFRFGNRSYDSTGVYVDTMQTIMHYDSIWTIHLTITEMDREQITQTLCEGDVFNYRDMMITRDTFFYDTLNTGVGCGKIVLLDIRFRHPQLVEFTAKTSTQVPYVWKVDTVTYQLSYSGVHTHIVKTCDGQCDSIIYRLNLSVYPTYDFRDSVMLCQSELPYQWHGRMLYEIGTYYDSLQTVHGFDSVYMLKILEIKPSYYAEQNVDLCEGAGAFFYRGKEYSSDGIFYDTIPSLSGCDSIFKITVRVFPTYEKTDTVHISNGERYFFEGRWLNKEGIYHAYNKTVHGCDSILHIYLKVHSSYYFNDSIDLCAGDTFYWHSRYLNQTGIYYDSLLTTEGYDSIYRLKLTVYPTYFKEEYHEICPGRTTSIHGIDISEPGIYMDTLLSSHGCDSVFKIIVNQTRSYRQYFTEEICQGDSILFDGEWRRSEGDYYRTLGCDSIIQMHLIVHKRSLIEKRIVISEEDLPYIFRGTEYTQGGVYTENMYTVHGCDSIFRLNLVVTSHVSEWNQVPLCPGSVLRIGADTITEPGLYTFVRRSAVTGLLDSLYRVEAYSAPAYDLPLEQISICQGDTLLYGGKKLTRGGHYDFALKTMDGCDSLLHLDLTVNPSYRFYEDATIADYDSYYWRGSYYNLPGEHSITFPTILNCDSTYTLRLTTIPTTRINVKDTICIGNSYTWRGQTITDPGHYTDTVYNKASFTSAIYSLDLHVASPINITSASVSDICADAENFTISFTYSGAEPSSYSVYFDQAAHKEGLNDIFNHPFGANLDVVIPLPHKEKVLYQQHADYIRPGTYQFRLVLDNGVCGLSKSDTLSMLVKYPSWIIEQNWMDVVAPLTAEYNGGYQFGQYEWYVNGERQQTNGTPYLYSQTLRVGDQVVLYATRIGDSYSIPTCPLTISLAGDDAYETPIMIYPNQAPRQKPSVTLKANKEGSYRIISSAGHVCEEGWFEDGEQTITLPYVQGCYIIRCTTKEGYSSVHKVMIY